MITWVLLRGLMREQRHWGGFPGEFARVMGTDRIVTPYLPGNGSRWQDRSPTRIADMTDDCRARLQAQGYAPPYALLALSLGGMVVCDWAHRYPTELAGGVLINTSLRRFSPFWQRLRPANYPALLHAALRGDARRLESTVLRLTSHRADADVLEDWLQIRQTSPVHTANALRQLIAAMRFQAPPAAPAVPLLVLASDGDRLVDSGCSKALAQAWHLPLHIHPHAGHDLPLDAPQWVATTVQAWAAQNIVQAVSAGAALAR
jgi:pimeloyl-ACP methyl ester carboxylesterase